MNVYGATVFEPLSETWVPFSKASDARVAQLLLRYSLNISSTAIDAVLDILNDPAFRVTELTFKRATDIESVIEQHTHRQIQCPRSSSSDSAVDSTMNVFDPEEQDWIPFDTATDVLIAKLILEHNLFREVVDILIDECLISPLRPKQEVFETVTGRLPKGETFANNDVRAVIWCTLRNPAFDPAQITFKKAFDVYRRVREHKYGQLQAITASVEGRETAGVPRVILDMIVDILASEMSSLFHEAAVAEPYIFKIVASSEYKTLRQICLVHRSWVNVARRGLQRRAFVGGSRPFTALLRDSTISSHRLRELAIYVPKHSACEDEGWLMEEEWNVLAEIARNAPNLKELSLKISSDPSDGIKTFLIALAECSGMVKLRLVGKLGQCLEAVCWTISKLKQLTHLTYINPEEYINWFIPASFIPLNNPDAYISRELASVTPPESLQVLTLDCPSFPDSYWLLRPRAGYAPKHLDITLTRFHDSGTIAPSGVPGCLASLTSLRVQLAALPGDTSDDLDLNAMLLSSAFGFRRLSLVVGSPLVLDSLNAVTSSVVELCIEFQRYWGTLYQWSESEDRAISAFLRRTNAVRRKCRLQKLSLGLVVDVPRNVETAHVRRERMMLELVETVNACRDMDVELDIFYM
ncbi:hypothetical protein DFH11DRAFT_1598072 [Phellopilus nigrolimitatus]|nr:hypothetical protein DFH11DRAFT_1598072 [Phellopilus nigrolimitatus]